MINWCSKFNFPSIFEGFCESNNYSKLIIFIAFCVMEYHWKTSWPRGNMNLRRWCQITDMLRTRPFYFIYFILFCQITDMLRTRPFYFIYFILFCQITDMLRTRPFYFIYFILFCQIPDMLRTRPFYFSIFKYPQ